MFPHVLVDDSFILFRYADNFKHGLGLNFNSGEHLQSYTGFLMLGLYILLPFGYNVVAVLIGVLSYVFSLYFIYKLSSPETRILFVCCFAFSPAILVHVFSGLETTLFMMLTFSVYYFWREKKDFHLLLATILLSLCRPEGLLISIVLLTFRRVK